jgi:hypothetical protein
MPFEGNLKKGRGEKGEYERKRKFEKNTKEKMKFKM